jgi:hypothetical protein
MVIFLKKLILCCLILGIVGCGKSQEEIRLEKEAQAKALQEEETRKLEQERIEQENIIKTSIKKDLIDPESAIFTFKKGKDENVYCGTVNSKNRFGGYVGDKQFLATQYAKEATYRIDEYSPLDDNLTQYFHLTGFVHRWVMQCEDIEIKKDVNVKDCEAYSEDALVVANNRLWAIENDVPLSEAKKVILDVYKDHKYINVFFNDIKHYNLKSSDKDFPMMYATSNYMECLEGKKI